MPSWHVYFNVTAAGAVEPPSLLPVRSFRISSQEQIGLQQGHKAAHRKQSSTHKANSPRFVQAEWRNDAGSIRLKARLSLRQALGLWMLEGDSVLL